jgi:hypothetical protein
MTVCKNFERLRLGLECAGCWFWVGGGRRGHSFAAVVIMIDKND